MFLYKLSDSLFVFLPKINQYMSLLQELKNRSGNCCEFCSSTENLTIYEVPPTGAGGVDGSLLACSACMSQLKGEEPIDANHWRCLNDSMWSEHRAVKVVVWRMLNRLKDQGWSLDLLNMMYLDDEQLAFAKATDDHLDESEKIIHRDSNGVVLEAGNNVVLIKDLKVKGSSMVAKQGTVVRRISLNRDNAEYIEGKVDGQQIVIITQYVKKV